MDDAEYQRLRTTAAAVATEIGGAPSPSTVAGQLRRRVSAVVPRPKDGPPELEVRPVDGDPLRVLLTSGPVHGIDLAKTTRAGDRSVIRLRSGLSGLERAYTDVTLAELYRLAEGRGEFGRFGTPDPAHTARLRSYAARIGTEPRPIPPATFPTPQLVLRFNDPVRIRAYGQFAMEQAAASNMVLARLREQVFDDPTTDGRLRAVSEAYEELVRWRHGLALEAAHLSPTSRPPADFVTTIAGSSTSYDPFGEIPGAREGARYDPATGRWFGGVETPRTRTARRMGELVEERFADEGVGEDVLPNVVRPPGGAAIRGNSLVRGFAADEADFRKSGGNDPSTYDSKYGFDREGSKIFTRTARPSDQDAIHGEAMRLLAEMMAPAELHPRRGVPRSTAAAMRAARARFALAVYLLFQAPLRKGGSDSVYRSLAAATHTHVFSAPPRLPHDLDIQAYVRPQDGFVRGVNAKPGAGDRQRGPGRPRR